MIQVIQRQEGCRSTKSTLADGVPQISYNDHGHLCVRLIHDSDRDSLVVFDKQVSDRIIRFLRNSELPF